MRNLGVYIQVPFCQTKCTYCNFHTGVVSRDRYAPYAEAVCREIAGVARGRREWRAERSAGRHGLLRWRNAEPARTNALATVLEALKPRFADASEPEITLEADPETIDRDESRCLARSGIQSRQPGSAIVPR